MKDLSKHSENVALENFLAKFRETARADSERSPFFWMAQRTRIRASLKPPQSITTPVRAFAALTWVVVLAVGLLWLANSSQLPQVANENVRTTAQISDEALMRSIEETTAKEIPEALAPVTVIASEVDRGLKSNQPLQNRRSN